MEALIHNTIKKTICLLCGIVLVYGCAEKKETDPSTHAIAVGLAGSHQGEVWIKKQDSTLHTIVAPNNADGIFETAELSPNKRFYSLPLLLATVARRGCTT